MKKKDTLGQETIPGDWVTITQNNTIYVGKVVSITDKNNATIDCINFSSKRLYRFSSRNEKYLKINPTIDMLESYDKLTKKT